MTHAEVFVAELNAALRLAQAELVIAQSRQAGLAKAESELQLGPERSAFIAEAF